MRLINRIRRVEATLDRAAVFPGVKSGNAYAKELKGLYNVAPKSVLAAVAVAFATQLSGTEAIHEAQSRVLAEWEALYNAGIVPQKPPVRRAAVEG